MYYVNRSSEPMGYHQDVYPIDDTVSFETLEEVADYIKDHDWSEIYHNEYGHTVYLDENLDEYYHFDFQGMEQQVYLAEAGDYDEAFELANQRLYEQMEQERDDGGFEDLEDYDPEIPF